MYGTVRTVVWEGGGRDTYVTCRALPDTSVTRSDMKNLKEHVKVGIKYCVE